MSIQVIFQIIETFAVVVGVAFALVQFRHHGRDKRREGAMELLHSFQTPTFAEALQLVYNLPDGLSKDEVEIRLGDKFRLVYALMTTWESLGILVCRGEIDLEMVDDFFSGPIIISWRKLNGQVMGERAMLERVTIGEWFQWLAERLSEREAKAPPVPAHVAQRDWRRTRPPT